MSPIRIIVNGAKGRMGHIACETLSQISDFTLVGQSARGDDLKKMILDTQAQVVVDLTLATCAFENTKIILNAGAKAVIGTSGLTQDQILEIKTLCQEKKLGCLIVPNFSLGNALLLHAAKLFTQYFSDVEIIEAHHTGKIDSPSGTALHLANTLAKVNANLNENKQSTLQGQARGLIHENIPIHALRTQGLMAEMTALFGGQGETLSVHHHAHDRACYMPGLCLSIRHVMDLSHCVVGLENVLMEMKSNQ